MNAPRIASLLAILTLTAPVEVLAQQEPIVAPGDRIRVTWQRGGVSEGTVTALMNDTLVLDVGGRAGPIHSALANVKQLELSHGRKSRALQGVAIGFLAGAFTGSAIGLASGDDTTGFLQYSAGEKAAVGAAVFGGLGLVIGAAIGSRNPSEQWQEVPLDRLRVSLVPQRKGGLAIGVGLKF